MLKYDCRNIQGSKCKHLRSIHDDRIDKIPDIYICNKHHITLFPEKENRGKINEHNTGLSPDFNCVVMSRLRKYFYAPKIMFSINPDRTTQFWNPTI